MTPKVVRPRTQAVLDYLQEVDFHLPGATPQEFLASNFHEGRVLA